MQMLTFMYIYELFFLSGRVGVPILPRRRRAAGLGALQVLRVRTVRQEGQVPLPAQGFSLQVLPPRAGLPGHQGVLQVQPRAAQ